MSAVPHPPPSDPERTTDPARTGGDPGRTGDPGRGVDPSRSGEGRDLWPRDFGRDGVSGLVTLDRAVRARDVSRPGPDDEAAAETVLDDLLARVEGRPRTDSRPRPPRAPTTAAHPVPHPPSR